MTSETRHSEKPRRLDAKSRPLLIIVPLAVIPPLGTWVAMQWFEMSFVTGMLASIIVTLAIGFPAKWIVDSLDAKV